MNSLFTRDSALSAAILQLTIALRDANRPAIVLVIVDDPFAPPDQRTLLPREARGELAERLFGTYTLYEFNFATAKNPSLPRFCRTLLERPACIFAYGLETLADKNRPCYLTTLELLNNQREDIRDTRTTVVLWLTPDTANDVLRLAPDFAMWQTTCVTLSVKAGEDVPETPLGQLSVVEADDMRWQARRYEEMLAVPELDLVLVNEYQRQLCFLKKQLIGREWIPDNLDPLQVFEPLQDRQEAAYRTYLEAVLNECKYLDPRGVPQTVKTVTVPLDDIYLSLTAERQRDRLWTDAEMGDEIEELTSLLEENGTSDALMMAARMVERPYRMPHGEVTQRVGLPEALRESSRLIVLGVPGSGKTTLTRFLTAAFAKACLNDEAYVTDKEGNVYGPRRMPIRLRIAEYADAFRKDRHLSLKEFLPTGLKKTGLHPEVLAELFASELEAGKAFVILDGLDEVADSGDRQDVADQIDRFVQELAGQSSVLITSRIVGYQDLRRSSTFTSYRLQDMNRTQIERFLRSWCVAVEKFQAPDAEKDVWQRQGNRQAEAILQAVDTNTGVQRLATNPLLLTVLALIHRNGARMPDRRLELYETAAKTLLRDWRLQQVGKETRVIDESEAEEMLGPLAYWMHETAETGLVTENEARAKLVELHAKAQGKPVTAPDVVSEVDDFLRRVREHTGLFVERAPGMYGFMHLTFEEYFAAQDMVSFAPDVAERIYRHRHDPRWEEPIRLAIAMERPRNAARLIRTAILAQGNEAEVAGYTHSQYNSILRRDLLLAARCMGDCASIEPILAREVAGELVDICLNIDRKGRFAPLVDSALAALEGLRGSAASFASLRPKIISALQNDDAKVRAAAANTLGAIGYSTDEVLHGLIEALKDQDGAVRRAASQALTVDAADSEQSLQALLIAVRDDDGGARYWLASCLGQVACRSAVGLTTLLTALKDEDSSVRSAIAWSLRHYDQNPTVLYALLVAIKDDNSNVRYWAVRALEFVGKGSSEALLGLFRAMEDTEDIVRTAAASGIGIMGQGSVEALRVLLKALDDNDNFVRLEAARSLWSIIQAAPEALLGLLKALEDKDEDLRVEAAGALGKLRASSSEALHELLASFRDKDEDVRNTIAFIYSTVGLDTSEALKAMLATVKDRDRHVRSGAARALGTVGVGSSEALQALLTAVNDEHAIVREAAAGALGTVGVGSSEALQALLEVLEDEHAYVRDTAWEAVWRLVAE